MPTGINLVPNNTGSSAGSTLGTDSKKWSHIYARTGSIDVISSSNSNLNILGDLTVDGDTTIKGNLTFGDATTDSVNFGAEISSSIIPDANDAYDLGSSTKAWSKVYTDDLYLTGSSGAIYQAGTKRLTLGSTNTFVGNISASGGISASQLTTYDDITLKYNADGGDTLVRIYDSSDDGIIDVYQNNSVKSRIHGNGLSYLYGGGLHVSGASGNITASGYIKAGGDLYVGGNDIYGGTTKRLTLGATNTFYGVVSASGGISASGDIVCDNGGNILTKWWGGDTLVKLHDSGDDGIIDVYQNNSVTNRIHGNGLSYISGGNAAFGTKIDSGKQLTVAGDISASGDLYLSGNDIYDSGQTKRLSLGSTNTFVGNITSSDGTELSAGYITASKGIQVNNGQFLLKVGAGYDYSTRIYSSNDDGIIDVYQNNSVKSRIHGNGLSYLYGGGLKVSGSDGFISASGNLMIGGDISASGNLNVSQITGSKGRFTNLPTTPVGIPSGSLYTLSGSQLGMSSSYSGNLAKIVLLK